MKDNGFLLIGNSNLWYDPKTGLVFADVDAYKEFLKKVGYK